MKKSELIAALNAIEGDPDVRFDAEWGTLDINYVTLKHMDGDSNRVYDPEWMEYEHSDHKRSEKQYIVLDYDP